MTQKKAKKKPAAKKVVKEYQRKEVLMKLYPKESAGAIARKYGVSRAAVLHQLRKHGIKITTRTSPKVGQRRDDIDRSYHKKQYLEKQLKDGLTIHGIAKQCGCGFMQVRNYIIKHGLLELAQQMKAKKPAAKKKPAPKAVKKEKQEK